MRSVYAVLICLGLSGCGQKPGEPPPTDKLVDELRGFYEKALEEAPDDPVEWAKEDIARFGDWEYRVVLLDGIDIARLESRLNDLGAERWEAFWVDSRDGELVIFLKRPTRSYLRNLPLSGLGKALSGGGSEE